VTSKKYAESITINLKYGGSKFLRNIGEILFATRRYNLGYSNLLTNSSSPLMMEGTRKIKIHKAIRYHVPEDLRKGADITTGTCSSF
jgi:hypothetical protein